MKFKRIILIILAVIVLIATLIFVTSLQKARQMSVGDNQVDTIIEHPNKIDYGASVPEDFPTNIPIEEGAIVNQSYGLNYEGQKQLTTVFASTKTVAENYSLYSDFLKDQNWKIINSYQGEDVSSFYAGDEMNDINITLTKGQVSISFLKK